ncbi:MAG: hypothetical protein K2N51_11125 [Lachnospiraceae bacterium]|nr:hypothetical protein [Lachnospiraceae bacterium]
MKRKILSVVLVASLIANPLTSYIPRCNAKEIEESIDVQEYLESLASEYGENVEVGHSVETVEEDEVTDIVETEQDVIDTQVSKEDGIKYFVETYIEDGVKYVKAYSEDMKYVSLTAIEDENNVISEVYTKTDDAEYEKNTIEVSVEDVETQSVKAQDVRYNGSVVNTKIRGKYYYQEGYGYDTKKKKKNGKAYLKIGCNYHYQLRTDNLSNSKQDKVLAYKSSIRKSNSCAYKAEAALVGSGVSLSVLAALIWANIICPVSVIVDICVAAFGGGGIITAVYFVIDAFGYVDDAHDYYEVIKYYGTRI